MGEKVRIGMIGVGQIGKAHLRRYQQIESVEIVAIADIDEAEAERVSGVFVIPNVYTDFRDLLARDDIEAVDVCLHNNFHMPMTVAALEAQGDGILATLSPSDQERVRKAGFTACVACTDVHEYGKILETVLERLGIDVRDAGVSADPDDVARKASAAGADFIAVSTISGVALGYLQALGKEMARIDLDVPVFIGGKLNQIPGDTASSLR